MTYRISEDEFVRASQLYSRPSNRKWILYMVSAAILIVLAVFSTSMIVRYGALGAVIGGAMGGLLSRYVLAPWMVRRQYRSYAAIHEEQKIELEDAGLRFRAEEASVLVAWKHILRWRENDEFLLIYQNPRLYHMLPKALVHNGLDLDGIIEKLKENVGAAT